MNIEQLISAIMSHQKDGATNVTVDESYEVIGCEFDNGVIIIVTGEAIASEFALLDDIDHDLNTHF